MAKKGKIGKILQALEFAIEAVTFTQFIYQEALHLSFFSLNQAIRAKNYGLARRIYRTIRNDIFPAFCWFHGHFGWISIYSLGAFSAFRTACQQSLEHYADLLKE